MEQEVIQKIDLKLKEIDAIVHSYMNKNILPDKVCMDIMSKVGEIDEMRRQNATTCGIKDYLNGIEKKLDKLCNILSVNRKSPDGDISVGDSFREDHSIILTDEIKLELTKIFNV